MRQRLEGKLKLTRSNALTYYTRAACRSEQVAESERRQGSFDETAGLFLVSIASPLSCTNLALSGLFSSSHCRFLQKSSLRCYIEL